MKKDSIIFTITISFLISIILLILSFAILTIQNKKNNEKKYFDKYYPIARMFFQKHNRFNLSKEFVENLEEMQYEIIQDKGQINAITYNPKTKVIVQKPMQNHKIHFRVLTLGENAYIYINTRNITFLLKDKEAYTNMTQLYITLIFALLAMTLIIVYIITLKKLIPLKQLKEKVMNLGDENFDFVCNSKGSDEISLLALEFEKSTKKLKQIKDARNVFIRNIMHELKTPIIKGKFLVQLPNTPQNNEKMQNVFNRLEALINEFSSIEEIISSTKKFEHSNYFLNDIVDNALDILLLDEKVVNQEFANIKLDVNFKLFSVAVKNLIDNAIKYSNDGTVTIKTQDKDVIFENSGEPLKYELNNYFEPFFANNSSKDGFGLGLYIVNSILKANGYNLNYEYKDELNRFIISKE